MDEAIFLYCQYSALSIPYTPCNDIPQFEADHKAKNYKKPCLITCSNVVVERKIVLATL